MTAECPARPQIQRALGSEEFLPAPEVPDARNGEQCSPEINDPLLTQKRCIGPAGLRDTALLLSQYRPLARSPISIIEDLSIAGLLDHRTWPDRECFWQSSFSFTPGSFP